jgi:uncharacterized protein (DUF1778 family)
MSMIQSKSARVQMVLSPSEKELFMRAAEAEGLSLSAWVRYVVTKAAKKVLGTKDDTRPTV